MALFVSAAQGDLYGALLWYQSPKIWVFVSAVREPRCCVLLFSRTCVWLLFAVTA
jgi:hypothetical protein